MRKFSSEGHKVYIISPFERRLKQQTEQTIQSGIHLLKIKTLNIQKTNVIEKGIATLLLEYQFLRALKKYYNNIKFDLILYSTPPITYAKVIKYIKKRDSAKSYLLLKDIFPQNAVDIGLMKKNGFLYKYFRNKEKELYKVSDFIGCMSPENVKYILKHNPEIDTQKVEVNPNSIEPVENNISFEEINRKRAELGIPEKAVFFLYGGNLGLPQGIDFLVEVLNSQKDNSEVFFLIVGSGTMYPKIKKWIDVNKPENVKLIEALPKNEYDEIVKCCDVGMIFLDKRFTIPNFPSRLLSYLETKKPVNLATDKNTDMGKIAEENNFGFWTESGDLNTFNNNLTKIIKERALREKMGQNGFDYFINNYTTSHSYKIIMKHFENVH